jgi:hypothetical protein
VICRKRNGTGDHNVEWDKTSAGRHVSTHTQYLELKI